MQRERTKPRDGAAAGEKEGRREPSEPEDDAEGGGRRGAERALGRRRGRGPLRERKRAGRSRDGRAERQVSEVRF